VLESAAFHTALVTLFVAGGAALMHLATGRERARLVGTLALLAAFSMLSVFIFLSWYSSGGLPFGVPSFDLIFLGYVLIGVLVAFDLRFRLPYLRSAVTPVAVGIFFLSLFAIGKTTVTTQGTEAVLRAHVALILLAMSLYLVAAIVGSLYLRTWTRLKTRGSPSATMLAPSPLERLGHAAHIARWLGFAILSLALLAGALYSASTGSARSFGKDPLVLSSIVLYAFLAFVNHARQTGRLSERRSSQMTLCSCIALFALFVLIRWGLHD